MGLSQLAKSICESPTLKLNETGEPVIHLGGGEPKSKAPVDAIVNCAALLRTGDVKYTPAKRIPALKKSIENFQLMKDGCPEDIVNAGPVLTTPLPEAPALPARG